MIVGIDASNIWAGGTVTHLVELIEKSNPSAYGISRVIVWSRAKTQGRIADRPWLVKPREPILNKSLPFRAFWQRFWLSREARKAGCDVLFVPGGAYAGDFHPMVTASQNLLPFEWSELRRFGWSLLRLKLTLLRFVQARTFRRADGVIFLTNHARDVVMGVIKTTAGKTAIIPHGVDDRFFCAPRAQLAIDQYSSERPFRILYVSIIDMYKHQWHVAEAVAQLRAAGWPVVLELIGPARPMAMTRLKKTLARIDPAGEFVRCLGKLPYGELHARYREADLSVFASSCENMPNILLEGMAAGLPIACSNCGPMPELLGDAGVYFDPENPRDIARALRALVDSPQLRAELAMASFKRAQVYSWTRCAAETLEFLAQVASSSANQPYSRAQSGTDNHHEN
jgi:glycosyltransferase involved in cell wall biosynthesis